MHHEPAARTTERLTAYYDGACPLCRLEVGLYRRRCSSTDVQWIDAAHVDAEYLSLDLSRADALARFHVRLPDGTLRSGPQGFAQVWMRVPGLRWLGKFAQFAPTQRILESLYRGFLHVRPAAQRLMARFDTRRGPA